jgi:DeoR/GlpR family transcriptional regulator of sugar metabolism
MIESSEKVVLLSIAEKLNSSQRIKVCDLKEINILITELQPNDELLAGYKKAGLEIL